MENPEGGGTLEKNLSGRDMEIFWNDTLYVHLKYDKKKKAAYCGFQ